MSKPKTLITAHLGADFDAFGSMIAASKIFPSSWLVWPGTTDDHLNHFVLETSPQLNEKHFVLSFEDIEKDAWKEIETLVVVDTRKFSRLKHIQPLLDWFELKPEREDTEKQKEGKEEERRENIKNRKNRLRIIVYDHHPSTQEDLPCNLPCDSLTYKEWGSASSILTMEIAKMNGDFTEDDGQGTEKKIVLSGDEATWISLGIYQDTGNFSYSNTTRYDLEAAGYLRRVEGFKSDFIFEYLNGGGKSSSSQMWERDEGMLKVYASLAASSKSYKIGDEEFVIAEVNSEEYVNNFATLAQGLAEREEIENLFCIARLSDRCVIVGRSRSKDHINVGFFCKFFGGGGHHCAASASIKNLTPFQIKQQLLGHLNIHLGGLKDKKVSDFVVKPAILVHPNDSVTKAKDLFDKNPRVKRLLVIKDESEECIGWIDRSILSMQQTADKSLVDDFVHPQTLYLLESDPIDKAVQLVSSTQTVIPVYQAADRKELIGVITRKDLNLDSNNGSKEDVSSPLFPTKRSVSAILAKSYPEYSRFFEKFSKYLESIKVDAFVVGKFVRNILMEKEIEGKENIPIVLLHNESNNEIDEEVAKGFVEQNDDFKLVGKDIIQSKGVMIQIVSSKFSKEEYLSNQTQSMDFTIDSIAFGLIGERFGEVINEYGGETDLKNKSIQAMHSSTFEEDPTRILSAILSEIELGFSLGKQSEKLIRNSMTNSSFKQIIGQYQLFNSFKRTLEHPQCSEILKSMEKRFHLLEAIHKSLKSTYQDPRLVRVGEILDSMEKFRLPVKPSRWKVMFLTLVEKLKDKDVEEIMKNLGISFEDSKEIQQMRVEFHETIRNLKKWSKEGENEEISELIGGVSIETLIEVMASQEEFQNVILAWMFSLKNDNQKRKEDR